MNQDKEEIKEGNPQEIAKYLFSKDSEHHEIVQFLTDINDNEYVFEMLLNILMEGIQFNYGDLTEIEMKNITAENIAKLSSYFHRVGFDFQTDQYSKYGFEKEYFCKIIIKNQNWKEYFEIKQIESNYHFLINPEYIDVDRKSVKDYRAIILTNDAIIMITFDYYKELAPTNDIVEKKNL